MVGDLNILNYPYMCLNFISDKNTKENLRLRQKKRGKLLASHRYNLLPLLRSRPGGFRGSWSYKTYPSCKSNTIILFHNAYLGNLQKKIVAQLNEQRFANILDANLITSA